MTEPKKNLVILTNKKYLSIDVQRFFQDKYNCTFLDRPNKKYPLARIDLILFTGGKDVNPYIYKEDKIHHMTRVNNRRDITESVMFNKYPVTIPKMGICRGAQLLTALSGGKVIQHVTNHLSSHNIITSEGKTINVISTHHQMMYPNNIDSKHYKLLGTTLKKISTRYESGEGKDFPVPKDFKEPEIVYYKNTRSLAIQGHPERSYSSKGFKEYSYELLNKLLLNEL